MACLSNVYRVTYFQFSIYRGKLGGLHVMRKSNIIKLYIGFKPPKLKKVKQLMLFHGKFQSAFSLLLHV